MPELIAYAKANPGKMSYGSSGVGSVFHLTGELFNRIAGVNITHVPYRGVAQPMQDTAAVHIQLLHISLSSARGALASGKAKVLAILEPKRYDKMPITRIVVAHRPALLRRAKRVFTVGNRKLTEAKAEGAERLAPVLAAEHASPMPPRA